MSQLKDSQHLQIPLKDIEIATKHFEECIGRGGYGRVYKGELFISGKQTTVAVKRLNENLGQGLKEFLTEIQLLSGQMHPNLISLLGYCDEGKEKIIVYEYADRGSLDQYIRCGDTTHALTWPKRLKICSDAARGLEFLHYHVGKHQSIIHRDIKSSNILIDGNWVAKISDLGLSKLSLAGLNRSAVISHACGTPGYCEPEYIITGIVKKESDVYSFGMVLFEVLCGKLCNVIDPDGFLLSARLVKDCYENNKLNEIVDPGLKIQASSDSIEKFAAIAYRCLADDRQQRPPMNRLVKELEELVKIQNEGESSGSKAKTLVVGRVETLKDVQESRTDELVFFDGSPHKFDLEDLHRASTEVLGKGAYGTIYKAILDYRTKMIVTRLRHEVVDRRGFEQQMEIIGSVRRHPNVVPVIAYYYSKDETLLIYDCTTFVSLSSLLHGKSGSANLDKEAVSPKSKSFSCGNIICYLFKKRKKTAAQVVQEEVRTLDWDTRLQVALGTAKGIAHIHSGGDGNLTHGDIKSSNVLLNQVNHNGRVINFGLTPLMDIATLPFQISGYNAPEVIESRKSTQESDVYSFGVLLLEMLTGKAPVQSAKVGDEVVDLPQWVQYVVREEWTDEVFDAELMKCKNAEEGMMQMLKIAMTCIEKSPKKRPEMGQVVKMIEEIRMVKTRIGSNLWTITI